MLRLNPNDNQGIRYVMACCLVELDRDEDVKGVLAQYENDAAATWAYTPALLAFREWGDSDAARKALRTARGMNPHVPAFLLGERRLPKVLPEMIGFGDESEAIEYAAEGLKGWQRTPGALDWLVTQAMGDRYPGPTSQKEASS
jgi:hypothetical protein